MKIKAFLSHSQDPLFNLALEDWLLRTLPEETHILFLWRNHNTVVIGRSQNPWVECNLEKMQEDNVTLVRRQSGGGAVFHDSGNTNFTFISPKADYCTKKNMQIITKALESFHINAYSSGRNDLLVNTRTDSLPRKVSGSAYRQLSDRAFHHGTLLLHSDLEKLARYLTPKQKKLEAKGVKSVRARVANLKEFNATLTHDTLVASIKKSFCDYYQQDCSLIPLEESLRNEELHIQTFYEELLHWDWQYGKTLPFTHHLEEYFSWGSIDIHLDVKEGRIHTVEIFSDSLFPDFIEKLKATLQNIPYDSKAAQAALNTLQLSLPDFAKEIEDVKLLLATV